MELSCGSISDTPDIAAAHPLQYSGGAVIQRGSSANEPSCNTTTFDVILRIFILCGASGGLSRSLQPAGNASLSGDLDLFLDSKIVILKTCYLLFSFPHIESNECNSTLLQFANRILFRRIKNI